MEKEYFSSILYMLENLNKDCKVKKMGFIYEIYRNNDISKKYIGSTFDIDKRVIYHKLIKTSKKIGNLLENDDFTYNIIGEKLISIDCELKLFEDYYIFLNNSIENGYNLRYNCTISNVITKTNTVSIIKKYTYSFLKNAMVTHNNTIKYLNEQIYHNLFSDVLDVGEFNGNGFIKINDHVNIYSMSYLTNDHITFKLTNNKYNISYNVNSNKINDIKNLDIFGLYLIFWNVDNYTLVFKPGISSFLNNINVSIIKNSVLLDKVVNSNCDFYIIPIFYFKINKTTDQFNDIFVKMKVTIQMLKSAKLFKYFNHINCYFDRHLLFEDIFSNILNDNTILKISDDFLKNFSLMNDILNNNLISFKENSYENYVEYNNLVKGKINNKSSKNDTYKKVPNEYYDNCDYDFDLDDNKDNNDNNINNNNINDNEHYNNTHTNNDNISNDNNVNDDDNINDDSINTNGNISNYGSDINNNINNNINNLNKINNSSIFNNTVINNKINIDKIINDLSEMDPINIKFNTDEIITKRNWDRYYFKGMKLTPEQELKNKKNYTKYYNLHYYIKKNKKL